MPKAKPVDDFDDFFPEVIKKKVDDLIPYVNNTKKHPAEQVAEIIGSIKEFKFISPIEIADNVIVAGHGRLQAARQLGLTHVPCIDVSHLSEGQRKQYRIFSNRIAEKAPWINEVLAAELEELSGLPDLDVTLTGFDKNAIADMILLNQTDDDDEGETTWDSGNPIISYNLVFDDEGQQNTFYDFLRYLRKEYDGETIGGRLAVFLQEFMDAEG